MVWMVEASRRINAEHGIASVQRKEQIEFTALAEPYGEPVKVKILGDLSLVVNGEPYVQYLQLTFYAGSPPKRSDGLSISLHESDSPGVIEFLAARGFDRSKLKSEGAVIKTKLSWESLDKMLADNALSRAWIGKLVRKDDPLNEEIFLGCTIQLRDNVDDLLGNIRAFVDTANKVMKETLKTPAVLPVVRIRRVWPNGYKIDIEYDPPLEYKYLSVGVVIVAAIQTAREMLLEGLGALGALDESGA